MNKPKTVLNIQGLQKSYNEHLVLKDVNLTVGKGELVFVLGPSGSGKSTMLRCCNRLEEPSAGNIIIAGHHIVGIDDRALLEMRLKVGMVFQGFNLYPHMNVLTNVTLAQRLALKRSKKEAEERAMEMLSQVGLAQKAKAYPQQLSGGQQQRVAIARALALDPEIMLFDEPTSALDPELVGSVLNVMKDLKSKGMTMLVVSHEMGFARQTADRIVFMDGGYVVVEDTAENFFTNSSNERVREFLSRTLD